MGRALTAEFLTEKDLDAAARALHGSGIRGMEAYGPHPLGETARLSGAPVWIVPLITTFAAIVGAAGAYYLQYWMNAVDYPLNVGGRPLHSWPAFLPAGIIVGILVAGAATLIGMLVLCGLPRLEHAVFDTPGFERASQDRYFLLIATDEDEEAAKKIRAALEGFRPLAVHEVAA